eukprot:TRINITY_DN25062_c0_g1_i6.p1 TRINITY_DN25062_c0_g1~~TRINITY_DN25062_c0_g1_i6.p1  ORF type:complete len:1116 (+),score=260.32 TRINITY_DN25062_c0_g1_i6:241-3588(+)
MVEGSRPSVASSASSSAGGPRKSIAQQRKSGNSRKTSMESTGASFGYAGEAAEEFGRLGIFTYCSPAMVSEMAYKAVRKNYDCNEWIFRQGGVCNTLIMMYDGSADVIVHGEKCQELTPAKTGFDTADAMGELNLLGVEIASSVGLRAGAEGCVLLMLTRDDFNHCLVAETEEEQNNLSIYTELAREAGRQSFDDNMLDCRPALFRGLKERVLREIDCNLVRRAYFPKEILMHQGAHGVDMLFLRKGRVQVKINGNVVTAVQRGKVKNSRQQGRRLSLMEAAMAEQAQEDAKGWACFGELGLLGYEELRSATLVCETCCHVMVLYRSVFVKVLEAHSQCLDLDHVTEFMGDRYKEDGAARMQANEMLHEVQVFKECGCVPGFLNFLGENLEMRMYINGQKLVVQDFEDDKAMYIIQKGMADVVASGTVVANLRPGDAFGELVLLGLSQKRGTTVQANGVVHCALLQQRFMIKAMEIYPSERQKVLMLAFKKKTLQDQAMQQKAEKERQAIESAKAKALEEQQRLQQTSTPEGSSCADSVSHDDRLRASIANSPVPPKTGQDVRPSVHKGSALRGSASKHLRSQKTAPSLRESGSLLKRASMAVGAAAAGDFNQRRATAKSLTLADSQFARLAAAEDSEEESCTLHAASRKKRWTKSQNFAFSPVDFEDADDNHSERSRSKEASGISQKEQDAWLLQQQESVFVALSNSPIFKNSVTKKLVEDLGNSAWDRIYMPGEAIMKEKEPGDSMFIMISGKAAVFVSKPDPADGSGNTMKEQKIGDLQAGSISGELAMLGVSQVRSASIRAETICSMWEVSHNAAVLLIGQYPDMQSSFLDTIVAHLEHTVPSCIDSLQSLSTFDRKLRMLLGLYSDRRAYFMGNAIFNEGAPVEGMYILNVGKAYLEHKGVRIDLYGPSTSFNAAVLIGVSKVSLCTLLSHVTCHVIVITRQAFLQALEQYPSRQQVLEFKNKEISRHEQFKQMVTKACNKKGLWKTAAKDMAGTIGIKARRGAEEARQDDLRRMVKAWRSFAFRSRRNKRQLKFFNKTFHSWVAKHREAVGNRMLLDERMGSSGGCVPLSAFTGRHELKDSRKRTVVQMRLAMEQANGQPQRSATGRAR